MPDPIYGGPIDFKNKNSKMGADAMISQFLNIKQRYRQRLTEVTAGDDDAQRYFCSDDCAYVFTAQKLKDLIDSLPNKEKDCVVFFQGLKKQAGTDGVFKFGRPILIACAYKMEGETLTWIPINTTDESDNPVTADALEHPGDGTGGTGETNNSVVVTRNNDPDADTEFSIRLSFNGTDLNNSFNT